MTTKVVLYDDLNTPEVYDLLNAPLIEQRVKHNLQNSYIRKVVVSVVEDKTQICYAETAFTLRMGKQLYKKRTDVNGFTYNKITKKVRGWRGLNVGDFVRGQLNEQHHSMHKFLEFFKLDWLLKTDKNLERFITKTTFEGMISGFITNPKILVKRYMAVSLKCKTLHWRKVRDYISDSTTHTPSIHKIINVSTDPNEMMLLIMRLERIKAEKNDTGEVFLANQHWDLLIDTIKNADILLEKINPRWSLRRLRVEHDRLSNRIMGYVVLHGEAVRYVGNLKLPDNVELLSSEAEVFKEGRDMQNCLFTNYWEAIKSHAYFAVRMFEPERCTVGICNNWNRYTINQMYGKQNSPVQVFSREIISDWLEKPDVQDFFFRNQYFKKDEDYTPF